MTVEDRLEGLQDVLGTAGSLIPADRIRVGDFTRDAGERAADQLLDAHADLTAIMALNELMAVGVMAALRCRGISVPHDMSVTGFNDIQQVSV